MRRTIVAAALAAVALTVLPMHAGAQSWPVKPIRVIVPFAPGGPVDVVARLVQPKLQETLGQPLVIDNRTGAGGNIGTQAVAKSPADGYTLLVSSSAFAVNPSLTPTAGYDAERDFAPIAVIATQPNLIVVNPNLAARNLDELLRLARTQKLAYASPGSGTTPHLTAEHLFRAIGKVDVPAIHFKGAGPAAAAVVAGEPMVGSLAVTAAVPFIRSGKVRALAVSSAQRQPTMPDVPTFIEAGFPAIQDYTWVAMMAPAGTPAEVVARINDAINQAIRQSDVKERLEALSFETVGGPPREFAAYLKSEVARWAKVVKDTGAKLD